MVSELGLLVCLGRGGGAAPDVNSLLFTKAITKDMFEEALRALADKRLLDSNWEDCASALKAQEQHGPGPAASRRRGFKVIAWHHENFLTWLHCS